MAHSTNYGKFLWVNPTHLTPDELEYELKIRCLNSSGLAREELQQAFFREQSKEEKEPKTLISKKTILDEVNLIQAKLMLIRQGLEVTYDEQLITRLKHLYLRAHRSHALDPLQVQVRNGVLEEIEILIDHFGKETDKIQCNMSRNEQNKSVRRSYSSQRSNVAPVGRSMSRIEAYEFPPPTQIPRSTEVIRRHTSNTWNVEAREFTPNESSQPEVSQHGQVIENQCTSNNVLQAQEQHDSIQLHGAYERPSQLLMDDPGERLVDNSPALREPIPSTREIGKVIEEVLSSKLETMVSQLVQKFSMQQIASEARDSQTNATNQRAFLRNDLSNLRNNSIGFNPLLEFRTQAQEPPISSEMQPNHYTRAREQPSPRPPDSVREPRFLKISVDKWPVKFSGESRGASVEEFLKRVETLANNNRTTEAELLGQISFLLKSDSIAEEWYYTYSSRFTSWKIFKYMLKLRFGLPNTDKVTDRQIRDRKQLPHETFIAFVSDVERLCQKLTKPMDETQKLNIILDNMRDAYRPHLAFINMEQITLDALTSLCFDLDKAYYQNYTQNRRAYNVLNVDESNENNEYLEYSEEEINEIRSLRNRSRPRQPEIKNEREGEKEQDEQNNILCWNCRRFGHFWRDCVKQKKIFCHVCGQINVVINTCPNKHRFGQEERKNDNGERS